MAGLNISTRCLANLARFRRRISSSVMPLRSAHLQSVVGLVWRSVVLWMLLLALLTLANIVG